MTDVAPARPRIPREPGNDHTKHMADQRRAFVEEAFGAIFLSAMTVKGSLHPARRAMLETLLRLELAMARECAKRDQATGRSSWGGAP